MKDGNEKLYDFVARSNDAGLLCSDPSLTVESDAKETDINVIVKRFNITGEMPLAHGRVPRMHMDELSGEFHSFRTMADQLNSAEEMFMEYPADFRARFDNDAVRFADWATDPRNVDEMVELGLAVQKPVVENVVPPVNPAPVVTP